MSIVMCEICDAHYDSDHEEFCPNDCEEEKEDLDCCESSAYGFKCTCIKPSYKDSDDYGDYAYEQYRDGLAEEEKLNNE